MYWSVDDRNSACYHRNIEMDYLHFGIDIFMIDWRWIDCRLYYSEDW